jgi:4,5-DOPA dioxygenase extradiol
MTHLPALFVSHGAPTLALEPGATGARLRSLAAALPRPREILVVSAHWDTAVPRVGAAAAQKLIYDATTYGILVMDIFAFGNDNAGTATGGGEVPRPHQET